MSPDHWLSEFQRAVSVPEDAIDLARAALIIATDEYPDLDIDAHLARLDAMAREAQAFVIHAHTPPEKIERLNHYVFHLLGFRGNRVDYYDPRNSFLNDVLERRLGLPITLSLVYIEIARRLLMPIYGVGLPGQFVVKWAEGETEIFMDPFNDGEILDADGLRRIARETYQANLDLDQGWLAPVGAHHILVRMLNNLKEIFVERAEYGRALLLTEKLLALTPTSQENLRDAGVLAYQTNLYKRAAGYLQEYVLRFPDAQETERVQQLMNAAWSEAARLN